MWDNYPPAKLRLSREIGNNFLPKVPKNAAFEHVCMPFEHYRSVFLLSFQVLARCRRAFYRQRLRRHFFLSRSNFSLSAWYFFLSYKKKFVTKFVTCITNFVTCIRNFVTSVTNFVTNFFCADSEKWLIGAGKMSAQKGKNSSEKIFALCADNCNGHGR